MCKLAQKFLHYGHQWINDDDIRAVVDVLKGDWLSQGPAVDKFENTVSEYLGAKYAVAFSNGTAALHGAMYAAGMKQGLKGITTANTFAATANSMLYTGAEPIFCDVERATYCLNPEKTENSMSKDVRVIAPVSFAGYPVDIKKFRKIADKWGAVLIEDGCHALGAERNGKKVGTEADMTAFSFHPVKHITTGEGGMVTTNDSEFAKKLRLFRSHGITRNPSDFEQESDCAWYHEMQDLGYNYRLTDFQCILGTSQMKRLPEFVMRRREIAALYNKKFAGVHNIELPPDCEGHSWHLYPLWVNPELRKGLFDHLRKNDVGVQVHYIPVPLHPYYRKRFGYKDGMFPEAERMYAGEISLPMYPEMCDDDVDRVVSLVKTFVK